MPNSYLDGWFPISRPLRCLKSVIYSLALNTSPSSTSPTIAVHYRAIDWGTSWSEILTIKCPINFCKLQPAYMASLPNQAVQEALNILLRHIHIPEATSDDSTSLQRYGIDQMERESRNIQAVIEAFSHSLRQRIAAIHKERNQLVPIYRLPAEVLITIFEILKDPTHHHYYQSIQPLAQVSSRWRTTIQSAPGFWSKISNTYKPEFLKIILERSKKAPLDIYLISKNRPLDLEFLMTASSLASRWRRVRINGDVLEISELWLTAKQLPLLRSFEVIWAFHTSKKVPAVLLNHSPKLSHLSIAPYDFPLGSEVFSRLKSITMTAVVDDKALTCAQWHAFLSSASQLRSIYADGGGVEEPSNEPSVFSVSMPELKNFDLRQIPSLIIGTLLCSIITPQNSHPGVEISPLPEDGIGFIQMFPTPAPAGSLLSRIREMIWIDGYDLGWDGTTITAGRGERGRFSLFLNRHDERNRGDLFRSLIPSIGLPSLQRIRLSGHSFFQDEHFSMCIRSCQILERLVLVSIGRAPWDEGPFDGLEHLCTDLATTLQSDTDIGEQYWPCPNLKQVDITSYADFTSVLRLLKARNGLTSTCTASSSLVFPATLDEVRLRASEGDGISFRTTYPELTAELEAVIQSHRTKLVLLLSDLNGEEEDHDTVLLESDYSNSDSEDSED